MSIQTRHLTVYRGDDQAFLLAVTAHGQPLDLSGATLHMSLRPHYHSELVAMPPESLLITDPAAGAVAVRFSRGFSAAQKWAQADYDLRMLQDGRVTTLLRGTLAITDSITPMPASAGSPAIPPRPLSVAVEPGRVVYSGEAYDPSMLDLIDFYLQNGKQ